MPLELPLVSINLLTFNSKKYLKNCLDSVFSQTYPRLEILVVDNGSTDGTVEMLQEMQNQGRVKSLKISFNKTNNGFAGGHNQAIKQSRGEYVLCLNQDVILDKSFVEKTLEFFARDLKIAAVQGKLFRLVEANGQLGKSHVIDTTGLVMFKNRRIIARGQGQQDTGQFNQSEEVFGADGAVPVYRRAALEDAKVANEYFDEDFFCYKEDVDLAWRLRLYGWKTVYQPEAIAWHARTSGDSAAKKYFQIIAERKKINQFSKYLSFKNQRLTQIKNEQIGLLARHFSFFILKEIASWIYILIFEPYSWKAARDMFRQIPRAWKKRKIIMAKTRTAAKEMAPWFV